MKSIRKRNVKPDLEMDPAIIPRIIKNEKGLNEDEPESVGGVSLDGITKQAYDIWHQKNKNKFAGIPDDVRELQNLPHIVNAFYVDYLADKHVWNMPKFLQYIYADFVVNANAGAIKIVQRMAGVDDDGIWGSGTARAVEAWKNDVLDKLAKDPDVDNELITEFHEAKLVHYNFLATKNPPKFGRYLKGWLRRSNHVLSELQEYFEVDEPTPSAMDDDDIDVPENTAEAVIDTGSGISLDPRMQSVPCDPIEALKELNEMNKEQPLAFTLIRLTEIVQQLLETDEKEA